MKYLNIDIEFKKQLWLVQKIYYHNVFSRKWSKGPTYFNCYMGRLHQGILTDEERLGTINLLIKLAFSGK
jgi:hypothetical protein